MYLIICDLARQEPASQSQPPKWLGSGRWSRQLHHLSHHHLSRRKPRLRERPRAKLRGLSRTGSPNKSDPFFLKRSLRQPMCWHGSCFLDTIWSYRSRSILIAICSRLVDDMGKNDAFMQSLCLTLSCWHALAGYLYIWPPCRNSKARSSRWLIWERFLGWMDQYITTIAWWLLQTISTLRFFTQPFCSATMSLPRFRLWSKFSGRRGRPQGWLDRQLCKGGHFESNVAGKGWSGFTPLVFLDLGVVTHVLHHQRWSCSM